MSAIIKNPLGSLRVALSVGKVHLRSNVTEYEFNEGMARRF